LAPAKTSRLSMKITRMVRGIIRHKESLFITAGKKKGNRSWSYNARFTATHRTVGFYRVLQMQGVRVHRRTPCTSSARRQSRCDAL
jgi:hypothetical protein